MAKEFPYEVIVTGKKDSESGNEILYGPVTFMAKDETNARYIGLLNMAKEMGVGKVLKLDISALSIKARQF